MEDNLYAGVKITRKEVKDLVFKCKNLQVNGRLINSSLYLVKINENCYLKVVDDTLSTDNAITKKYPSIKLDEFTKIIQKSNFIGNKGNMEDYFYNLFHKYESKLTKKQEYFYEIKTKDLFYVKKEKFSDYSADKLYYVEGICLQSVDRENRSYLYLNKQGNKSIYRNIMKYKEMIIKSLDKLNLPREVDLTAILYDISAGINYYIGDNGLVSSYSESDFNKYIKTSGSGETYSTEDIYRIVDKYSRMVVSSRMKRSKRRSVKNEL